MSKAKKIITKYLNPLLNNTASAKSVFSNPKNAYIFLFFLINTLSITSCKTDKPIDPNASVITAITKQTNAVFLNKNDAVNAIVSDTMTHFFDDITNIDIALQFNKQELIETDSLSLRKQYQALLAAQTRNFTPKETELITHSFQQIFTAFSPQQQKSWLPRQLFCIKTTGENYNAYYTRNGCIIIPQNDLNAAIHGDTLELQHKLSHELFHIVSRYNLALRLKLYHRIGFDTIHKLLIDNELLRKNIIENPDGTQAARIKLNDTTQGTLICYSRTPDFKLGADNFHAHFKWGMFQVKKQKNNAWQVITDSLGESTLSNTWEVPFFRQVGTNTEYLIHPDEILADNFALLIQKRRKQELETEIDTSGTILLKNIETIIFGR